MDKIKIGVIGVGHLGQIHARIYKELDACSLEVISDNDQARLKEISNNLQVAGCTDYKETFAKIDAVSIAVPTKAHYSVAKEFIKNRIHVLIEKPFTSDLRQAKELIALAEKNKVILQVGHVERFNSAFNATLHFIKEPKFIECHRLSAFPNRSLDIGVVLDLMIHDIDIILGLVNSPVKKIEAVGVPVLTSFEDIANARITFKNGCVANLTASRVSDEPMRKIRIFQKDTYISLDYKDAKACVYKKDVAGIFKENLPIEKEQPLQKELASFLDCVKNNRTPIVNGQVAKDALEIALKIQNQIWKTKKVL